MNNIYIGDINLNSTTGGQEFIITLPDSVVEEGKNDIRFYGDTWSPLDYGVGDSRKMTISISEVEFTEPSDDPVVWDFGEDESFSFSGFSGYESTFRWTNSETAVVSDTGLWENTDYTCSVMLGASLPRDCFVDGIYEISILVNGKQDSLKNIQLVPGERAFSFDIDDGFLVVGENTISFSSALWSPANYGSTDTRMLGIAIDKIVFEKQAG